MNRSFWTELWYFLLFLMVGFILVAIVSAIVPAVFPDSMNSVWYYHFIQWMQTIVVMVIPAMLWCRWRLGQPVSAGLRLTKCASWKAYAVVILLSMICLPLLDVLAEACRSLPLPESIQAFAEEESANQELILQKMLDVGGFGGWIELILLMSVATAVAEEMTFRGALLTIFQRFTTSNKHVVAVVVGLIFSIIHMEIYGLIPRWLLGTAFVYLVYYTGSIWPSVLAHAINNLYALMQYKGVID